jgi:hypothetical protein
MKQQVSIDLWADYNCFPLWVKGGDDLVPRNLDPHELPISDSLAAQLDEWAAKYDQTLCESDPVRSGFATKVEHENFVSEGRSLALELRRQLMDDFLVYFVNDITVKRELVSKNDY